MTRLLFIISLSSWCFLLYIKCIKFAHIRKIKTYDLFTYKLRSASKYIYIYMCIYINTHKLLARALVPCRQIDTVVIDNYTKKKKTMEEVPCAHITFTRFFFSFGIT